MIRYKGVVMLVVLLFVFSSFNTPSMREWGGLILLILISLINGLTIRKKYYLDVTQNGIIDRSGVILISRSSMISFLYNPEYRTRRTVKARLEFYLETKENWVFTDERGGGQLSSFVDKLRQLGYPDYNATPHPDAEVKVGPVFFLRILLVVIVLATAALVGVYYLMNYLEPESMVQLNNLLGKYLPR